MSVSEEKKIVGDPGLSQRERERDRERERERERERAEESFCPSEFYTIL